MTAVIRYNAGNVLSVMNALSRIGSGAVLTDDPDTIINSDRVIFPGVGEASSAMSYLREKGLDEVIKGLTQPFLGICLGMQLMCSSSEEGDVECLGIFPERVSLFPRGRGFKIPHMGWNTLERTSGPLFRGIQDEEYAYFVHSYYVPSSSSSSALTEYDGITFSSALSRDNFHGVQFHPEKSGRTGERILRNFLEEA